MSNLFTETWGAGTPVVLVHGSLATGADEWQAQRPLVDQLTLLEPGTFALAQRHPAAQALVAELRQIWIEDLPDDEWVVGFLTAVGSDPATLGPELLAAAVPLVPVLRRGRPPWEPDLPFAELASAAFPKLVVSGGHSAGFEAICDDVAGQIGASRMVIAGAGHEVQFTGRPLNEALLSLWRA